MIEVVGTVTVKAPARAVLEFVCDLERYRQADTKIVKVLTPGVLGDDGRATAAYKGRLRGITSPADRNDVTLARWTRADFVGSPDSWVRRMVDFHGWFTCEETDRGTVVTHSERFAFKPPFRWVMEPYLRTWLQRDIGDEMQRIRTLLDG